MASKPTSVQSVAGWLKMPAKSGTERVKEFRERMRKQGLKEIRNLWAHPDDGAKIKEYVARLNKKRPQEG